MKTINSFQNYKIKEIIKLSFNDKIFFKVESYKLVKLCLKYNIVFKLIYTYKWVKEFKDFNNSLLVNEKIIKKISDVKTSQGIIAICYKKNILNIDLNLNLNQRILLLDDIQDPGNLGAILRSAVAFNFNIIITSKKSVSLFNPKVLRSSQGAFLFIKYMQVNLESYIKDLKAKEFKIIGTLLHDNNLKKIKNLKLLKNKKIALLFGNEGNGINFKLWKLIDYNYIIKISSNIESLNLAIACSIIMNLL